MLPSTIGPYRIVRLLGEGGMGVVYEAIHEAIERRVAIKLLRTEYARNAELTARFFNEARAVNRIEHPGLVQISDYAQLPDGSAYIVMEFLKGESLASRMNRGRLPVGDALNASWQIADALSAAHEKGIVHRDLKPDNVMLVADSIAPGGERAKLLDFGIAKLAEAAQEGQVKTRTDVIMGTPRFMAPEQCLGARNVDDKADVYALGVMLYAMLSGRPPFDGAGTGEVLAKHIYEAPPLLQSLVPDLPASLSTLVHRLLVKDKDQRPSMRRVLEDLGQLAMAYEPSGGGRRRSGTIAVGSSREAGGALGSSTLDRSTGQRLGARNRQRLGLVVIGSLLSLGGAAYFAVRSRSVADPSGERKFVSASPIPVASSSRERIVTWSIVTEPSGADVIRIRDGQVLGKTPWESKQPFAMGTEELRLRLAGYEDLDVSVSRSAHSAMKERLDLKPEPPSPPAGSSPTDGQKAAIKRAKHPRRAPTASEKTNEHGHGHGHGPVKAED